MAVLNGNIASLYSQMEETDAAVQWIQGALAQLRGKDLKYRPANLIVFATLRARQHRMDEARRLFAEGIAGADAEGNLDLAANGWHRLGLEYLKSNDLARAEGPLLEAYRISQLHQLPSEAYYASLGQLRLEQGDLEAASALLDRALEISLGPHGVLPTWDTYHNRGRVRMAQGRLEEAVADLRTAVRLAREWRWSAPADDAAGVSVEVFVERVHAAFIEAGNRLYERTGDRSLIRETFDAAEDNRAGSLRALVRSRDSRAREDSAEYWEALARLQQSEVRALRSPALAQDGVEAARAGLIRIASRVAPSTAPPSAELVDRTQRALDGDTVLLTCHLDARVSWMWALDREDLALYRLPAGGEIEAMAREAAEAAQANRGDSGRLWHALFGQLPARLQGKIRWLVALDRGLFETPLAALNDGRGRAIERHIIETIPGAGYWLESRAARESQSTGLFVGIGDAIYNGADPRLAKAPRGDLREPVALPRLVASAAEVAESARAWSGEQVLLEGAEASRVKLRAQLARNPAVVHLATHVVESGRKPAYGLIALSLTPKRENEMLSPYEIAGWHTGAGLVVLSGCHSAEGAVLPGTGLMGLTRAWLAAGARAVIASNWATQDAGGPLFTALYRHLRADPTAGPAAALRQAQLEMIQAGDWRANPKYWGTFFVMGAR